MMRFWQFLFGYEFLIGVFDNFQIGGGQVFVDVGVKSRVRKLLFLVEFDAANDCRATFVGRCDDEVISVFEIYEGSPFFYGMAGEFCV